MKHAALLAILFTTGCAHRQSPRLPKNQRRGHAMFRRRPSGGWSHDRHRCS